MNKECYVFMLCGLPGSGKSTWAKRWIREANYPIKYISRDEIRYSMLKPYDAYFSKEKEVFIAFIDKINEAIDEGGIIIIDATHLNPSSRFKVLSRINMDEITGFNFVFFTTDLNTCIEHNDYRTGRERVPHDVIRRMSGQLNVPTEYEMRPWSKLKWTVSYVDGGIQNEILPD